MKVWNFDKNRTWKFEISTTPGEVNANRRNPPAVLDVNARAPVCVSVCLSAPAWLEYWLSLYYLVYTRPKKCAKPIVATKMKTIQNPFLAHFGPLLAILRPIRGPLRNPVGLEPPQNGGNGAKRPESGCKRQCIVFWHHSRPFGDRFDPLKNIFRLWHQKNRGWSGQNAPKVDTNTRGMRFGTILGHLETVSTHLGANKIDVYPSLDHFWTIVGVLCGP